MSPDDCYKEITDELSGQEVLALIIMLVAWYGEITRFPNELSGAIAIIGDWNESE